MEKEDEIIKLEMNMIKPFIKFSIVIIAIIIVIAAVYFILD